jgi:hypothetical protein
MRELKLLAKEFENKKGTVIRTNFGDDSNKSLNVRASSFLRTVTNEQRKNKTNEVFLVAIIPEK